ncbi:MAG: hypothetical protein EOR11_19870 [Mesorhizobium sp.]|uniref:hypothetical protein n=1 Tax=Mesorhizobium sp. TaxID=1871066 RepID=UPI000FE9E954|nr:hypothetical protein [Mesorhizobium sp.]RWP84720.1 MAG: hypothetical protein EOR11_19870 [Mesorhizobium sp.]
MRTDFSDGSFMLSWSHCRAWFERDGTLKDAEYKRRFRGHPAAVAVSAKHTKVRQWLARQGKQEASLLERGILHRA